MPGDKKENLSFKNLRYSTGGVGHTEESFDLMVRGSISSLAGITKFAERAKRAKEKVEKEKKDIENNHQ